MTLICTSQQYNCINYRFLETEEYVGKMVKEVLTAPVYPDDGLRLWCGVVGTPPPKVTWNREGSPSLPQRHEHVFNVSPFTAENEVTTNFNS